MITRNDDIYKNHDEQLEMYLKQFRPADVDPLVFRGSAGQVRHSYRPIIWAISFAIVLIAGAFTLDYKSKTQYTPAESRVGTLVQPPAALTVGSANLLLKQSSSIAEALDTIAYVPQVSLPQGESSALATLGKEKFKL